jgi:hypothetical protein
MKRLWIYLCVLILLLPAAGCQLFLTPYLGATPDTDLGSLVVSVAAGGVKTLLPPLDMEPASYTVSGVGPSQKTFQETTLTGQVTVSDLAQGPWTVTVEALNAAHTVIGRGVGTVTVNAGKTASLQVSVLPLEGFGTLQLTVNWTTADVQSPTVIAHLLPSSGTAVDLSFSMPSPGTATCTKTNVGTGYYTLTVELRDSGVLVMGAMEVARIVKDQTTSGTFDFTQINLATGSIEVNITPTLDDPITVTLSGQQPTLQSGAQMTVAASVPSGTGNVACAWYLNGVSKAVGTSYTVGSGLAAGLYRLDVSVFSADGKRAGSATCSFQVQAAAGMVQATLEWDANSEPDLAGYKLHYGTACGNYTSVVDVGNQTTYTLSGLTAGTTYYITATAYNTAGLDSTYSNEVVFTSSL